MNTGHRTYDEPQSRPVSPNFFGRAARSQQQPAPGGSFFLPDFDVSPGKPKKKKKGSIFGTIMICLLIVGVVGFCMFAALFAITSSRLERKAPKPTATVNSLIESDKAMLR